MLSAWGGLAFKGVGAKHRERIRASVGGILRQHRKYKTKRSRMTERPLKLCAENAKIMNLSQEEITRIEPQTREQSNCSLWHEM